MAACALCVIALSVIPGLAVRAPTVAAAIETAALACLVKAVALAWSRAAAGRSLADLALLGALSSLAAWQAVAQTLPAALGIRADAAVGALVTWGEPVVAACLLAAILVPARALHREERGAELRAVLGGCLATLLACGAGVLLDSGGAGSGHPHFSAAAGGAPLAVAAAALTVVALSIAAAAVLSRRASFGDGAPWLVAGLAALALADCHRLGWQPLAPGWVSVADGVRLLGVALILTFAVRQDEARRRRLARGAALAERHRIAGDLHDGLAQDLAFIAAYGADVGGEETEHPIGLAARRALAVTRGVIADLADPRATSVTDALLAVAHELGSRFDMAITVDAPDDLRVSGNAHQDLLRIVREAIANAARHGEAGRVAIHAQRTLDGLELRVRDDGRGIVDGSGVAAPEGFGISSMRDRAAALGGRLTVASPAGGGTEVIVRVQ